MLMPPSGVAVPVSNRSGEGECRLIPTNSFALLYDLAVFWMRSDANSSASLS